MFGATRAPAARRTSNEAERLSFDAIRTQLSDVLALGDAGVVMAVDLVLAQGALHRASDIYFEPWLNNLSIRYRLDGALTDIAMLPKTHQDRLIARLKILAKLAVYEHGVPQDGRIDAQGRLGSMRVSTVPTIYGEKAVVRVLDPGRTLLPLPALGFDRELTQALADAVALPQGALLLTGPSSSGKTTTIYSLLRGMLAPDYRARHIVTLEDPVEYRIEGVTQMQVSAAYGPGFETYFRSVLRQDPDVIVVGEIRDPVSAQTTMHAGLTGHMVISTIHSGSAAAVFRRLLDMGVEPFLVASAVRAVLAQRLVRRVCPECAAPYSPDPRVLRLYGIEPGNGKTVRGTGCPACNGLGYSGRTAFGEMLAVTEEFTDTVLARPKLSVLQRAAEATGMRPLREAGRQKVLAGETTVEELRSVLTPEPIEGNAQ